jgi:predicted O-methyltransferase YrrM
MRIAYLLIAALSIALAILWRKWSKAVWRRRAHGYGRPWPIRRVPLPDVDPVFVLDPVRGYGPDTEVAFVSRGEHTLGATSNDEAWILAVLSRGAKTMFEFGTSTGRTAYLWARNSCPDAKVYTLTLLSDMVGSYQASLDDAAADEHAAHVESRVDRFVYTDTPVASKVVQLYGDSKAFDETPYAGQCDLIFVDGSHAYSYVVSDSEKALRMIKPGGLVLWHDYFGGPWATGSYRALNELSKRIPLVHIAGTTLVAHRAP